MAALQDPTAQDHSQQGPEESAEDFFSPQVRYAGANVTCSKCEYFDGASQCSNQQKIADGGPTVEPGGRCEQFDPADDSDQDDPLKQSIAQSKPFGEAASGYGVSNS